MERTYIAIDLKSFYASVECVERKLDPLDTNLVVADSSRTEKTICLAVSPGLKAYGIPGRCRLFEVVQSVREQNIKRKNSLSNRRLFGKSYIPSELSNDPSLEIDYIVARPRMSLYMKYSTDIYRIYLKYISPDDIHVYSCDEVFMDVTEYLNIYGMSAHELAMTMIRDVLKNTGITATAGIGTNLFLCKVAMDIVAKHMKPDADGVRIAELDEMKFRKTLWNYTPITDFWRIGPGTAKKLYQNGLFTMGDVAAYSEDYEENLYKLFGVNAELIIDHAWGWEPCTIKDIKEYRPDNNSLSSGQVLSRPYSYKETKLILREMADGLSYDLLRKGLVTDQIVLNIGYEAIKDFSAFEGEIGLDRYGRAVPKHAHGSCNLDEPTASSEVITDAVFKIYERVINPDLQSRRIVIAAGRVVGECTVQREETYEQLSLFDDSEEEKIKKAKQLKMKKEKNLQLAALDIREKYGKNAILKGTSLFEGATAMDRNAQIGGHRA